MGCIFSIEKTKERQMNMNRTNPLSLSSLRNDLASSNVKSDPIERREIDGDEYVCCFLIESFFSFVSLSIACRRSNGK
jgi:hypothetical protein